MILQKPKIPLIALSALILVSCSNHFVKADLIGKFILNIVPELEVIELKDDGTYDYSFESEKFPKVTRYGKWELDDTPDGQQVALGNFQPIPGSRTNGSGFYLLKPERFWGNIRLVRNSDLNEYYQKR